MAERLRSVGQPNPDDITTLQELVFALRALRFWAGLSLSEVSLATKGSEDFLPRSTVHDAQAVVARLPKLRVVKSYVRACGVDDVERWAEAWRRINPHISASGPREDQRQDGRPSIESDVREFGTTSAITQKPTILTGARLAAMPIAEAAKALAHGDPDWAVECIDAMPTKRAIARVSAMAPNEASALIERMGEELMEEIIPQLPFEYLQTLRTISEKVRSRITSPAGTGRRIGSTSARELSRRLSDAKNRSGVSLAQISNRVAAMDVRVHESTMSDWFSGRSVPRDWDRLKAVLMVLHHDNKRR